MAEFPCFAHSTISRSKGLDLDYGMSNENLIEIRSLKSFYNTHQVLFDISFAIPKRSVTVIMGVSGCGKTTLLRHLTGLKKTGANQIFIDGEDLGSFSETMLMQYRRRIGVLFQSGALFNSLSLAENIAIPLKVHTRLAAETIRIMSVMKLNLVGLAEFCGYMPSQISGGMKKRAGLARALIMDPEILFVDEPSSGLDPITAAGLDRLILELRETMGMTVVVVTHELVSAFKIADRIVVIDEGKILAAGNPEQVRTSADARVQQFLNREADAYKKHIDSYYERLIDGIGSCPLE
jgi:phospholipid/cholesterol/gamma-HCH transport system ATP-binding protein